MEVEHQKNGVATIFKVVEAKKLVESTNNYGISSVKKISTKSGVKPTTVYHILTRKLTQRKYRLSVLQELSHNHFSIRVFFAKIFNENFLGGHFELLL